MVGTVDDMSDSHDGLSYLLKIKLATDFGKVSNVRVIGPYRTRRAADIGEGRREMMGVISVRVFSDKQLMG